MRNLTLALFSLLFITSCSKDEKTEKRAIFYEVAGPSFYQVKFIDENNNTIIMDSVVLGWNKNLKIDIGKYAGIEAKKLYDTNTYTVDFLRMYINGVKFEAIDSGYSNTMSLFEKVK
jgi:hypothetical protein